jgi:Fe-S oxidoreductase
MAGLKAEYLYQRYKTRRMPLRNRVFGAIGQLNQWAALTPALSNALLRHPWAGGLLKRALGVAPARSLPLLSPMPWPRWWRQTGQKLRPQGPIKGEVWFFADEFTCYNDAHIGIKAVALLNRLGYAVRHAPHPHSGRAQLSKGLLDQARKLAEANVRLFSSLPVSAQQPLLGVEPSALLGFRDEYPRLLRGEAAELARRLAPHALLVEEFLHQEALAGRIGPEDFTSEARHILLHGHCHQKALGGLAAAAFVLGLPAGHTVEVLATGCCGMAGSFGYEAEHYALSMQIGALSLLPAVRNRPEAVIAAPGTSCRHQLRDGAGRAAFHPLELL